LRWFGFLCRCRGSLGLLAGGPARVGCARAGRGLVGAFGCVAGFRVAGCCSGVCRALLRRCRVLSGRGVSRVWPVSSGCCDRVAAAGFAAAGLRLPVGCVGGVDGFWGLWCLVFSLWVRVWWVLLPGGGSSMRVTR
jgi:hypothetical protein